MILKGDPSKPDLTLSPEGDIGEWHFYKGTWCGKAHDSVSIHPPGRGGCVLTRADVKRLREFLQHVEATWTEPEPDYSIFNTEEKK